MRSGFIQIVKNMGIGTTSIGTNGDKVLSMASGTAPTSSPSDCIQLYAEDVSSSSELKVRDELGNITTLSPHNFSLVEQSHPLAWTFHSEKDGYIIEVDMLQFIQIVEELTGEKFIYIKRN